MDITELRYIAHNTKRERGNQPKPFESWFEVDVYLEIVTRGYRAIPQFECAGKFIDIVVEGASGSQLAVECDGDWCHGIDQYEKDMERQRMLERVGWKFHRIRECAFRANPEETLAQLWRELEYRGIFPIDEKKEKEETQEDEPEEDEDLKPFLFEEMRKETIAKVAGIKEALAFKPSVLRDIIKDILRQRPNQTAKKDALPGLVLKHLGVISREQPREAFCRKVKQALAYMRNNAEIEEYQTSKNKRLRLMI